jgi:acyl-coenzyme A thioesterase PaaI-like protein
MNKQANSCSCFVCGIDNPYGLKLQFYSKSPGTVLCDHIVPEQFSGYPGTVHGGIIASMMDELLGRVFIGESGTPRFMYTARLTIHYRKPVPIGQPLHMEAIAVKDKKRIAESKGSLYGPGNELLVEAEGILVNIPPEKLEELDFEALGWRVYAEE